jgi:hypothetical protein
VQRERASLSFLGGLAMARVNDAGKGADID